MTEELKSYLFKLMGTVDGLFAIAITDRDGVVIVKVANQMAPDTALRPAFLSVFGVMTEQASKMGIGTNKRIINFYDKYQTVQVNNQPLLLHFIADKDANTGLILELEHELEDVLRDISKRVSLDYGASSFRNLYVLLGTLVQMGEQTRLNWQALLSEGKLQPGVVQGSSQPGFKGDCKGKEEKDSDNDG